MVTKAPAAPAEQPVKLPEPPITIAEIKPPGKIEVMETGDYVPSASDLANLAKNQNTLQQAIQPPPEPVEPQRAVIIPPSIAKRTMEELEAGRKIVERREEERRRRMAG